MTPALFTDLYELNMAQAYHAEAMHERAVFELSYRKLPERRNFICAAGIREAAEFLCAFHFTTEECEWLQRQPGFSPDFLARLKDLKFTGDVYAPAEGTPIFPHEPLLQVIAPIIEAQLVETAVLNLIHFESLALTKAARVVRAAKGRPVVDFGARRAPGTDAALRVARALYLAGGHGTSNVLAGRLLDIPVFGTMAHSYIEAHDTEAAAFEAFAQLYPRTTLLVDTYDTLAGIRLVIDMKRRFGEQFRVAAVRLDSGDLATLSRETRSLLDEAGLQHVTIFATSGLDEYKIERLMESQAPIDGFGVGTKLSTCADTPELDMAYKLVEYAGKDRCKLSPGKTLYPGRKQVFRLFHEGRMAGDTIARFDEVAEGTPLLRPIVLSGKMQPMPDLTECRSRIQQQFAGVPEHLLSLQPAAQPYPVRFSGRLVQGLEGWKSRVLAGATA